MSQPPIHVQTLEYAQMASDRPRMFLVVSFTSILIAIFGILISCKEILIAPQPAVVLGIGSADPQLATLSMEYTNARLETIEANATYMSGHPILARAKQREAELSKLYQAKINTAVQLKVMVMSRIFVGLLLNLLLNIFLLISGIVMVNQTRNGRRMHLVYSFTQISLAILSVMAWIVTIVQATHSISNSELTWVFVVATVACVYPVILLVILQRRSVKEHCAKLNQ
jgi:hypothetical protein